MYPSNRPWGKEQMDDLDYQYQQNPQGYLANNRLTQVTDAVEAVRYTMDIDQQGANNYGYDAIGNLVRDDAEKILNISWTVYGKIASIQKDNGLISYRYDAAGNRVYKESTMGGGLQKTWYVRDAQGNTLAVYNESGSSGVTWAEQQLYGSSRLGYWQIGLPKSSSIVSAWNDEGGRLYELSNHLGNVMAVVTDKAPDGQKNAELVRLQDYYAFGMEIPGRRSIFEGSSYRYGFNGKENDNEIKGEGNQQDYGMRIYDPRIGKFLSVDPKTRAYSYLSGYSFAGNNPIELIDQNGLEPVKPLSWYAKAWYHATNQSYLVRLNDYAVKQKIDDSQVTLYSYNNKNFAIVLDFRKDTKTGELFEQKQVFREVGKAFVPTFLSNHDSYNQEVDNYFDDNGNPIPTERDESYSALPSPVGPGGFGKAGGAFALAGSANKSWTIYTFITNVPKEGRYFGLTVDFARRMAQHGARIVGTPTKLIENIPDKLTARGVEQLFINYGRKLGVITDQINSINPKRVERTKEAIEKATKFLKDNHGDKFDYLF